MSRGSNGRQTFFGLEFTHTKDPDAIVFKTSRFGKLIKWVDSYKPTTLKLASGHQTLRERVGVQCPLGFILRKDEIHSNMKQKKTGNYQNGKFFTIMDHVVAKYRHPEAEAALKTALIENKPKEGHDGKINSTTGGNTKPTVSREDRTEGSTDSATPHVSVDVDQIGASN